MIFLEILYNLLKLSAAILIAYLVKDLSTDTCIRIITGIIAYFAIIKYWEKER